MVQKAMAVLVIAMACIAFAGVASAASPVIGTWEIYGVPGYNAVAVINPDLTGSVSAVSTPYMLLGIIPWQDTYSCHFGWRRANATMYAAACMDHEVTFTYDIPTDRLISTQNPSIYAARP